MFHWLNLLLHIANCLLVFTLLLMLLPRSCAACTAGALVFGLHPLQVESVAWASGVDRAVNGLFSLLALIVYVGAAREQRTGYRRILYATAIILGILAYLAKPVAVALPLAALAIDRFLLGREWKKALLWYLPWQSAFIPFFFLTHAVTTGHDFAITPLWTRPFIAGDALAWHLFKLLLPFNLGIDYGRNPDYILSHWWGYFTWLAPAAVLGASFAQRRFSWIPAAFALWLAALLPNIGIVPFPFEYLSVVADRYDYLALTGPALAVAAWLAGSKWRYSIGATVSILILYAGLSASQSLIWKDTPALMAQQMAVNPSSPLAPINLGMYYEDHGQIETAMPLYLESIKLDRSNIRAHMRLAWIYVRLGRETEAENLFRQVIALKPDSESSHYALAYILNKQGRLEEAARQYRAAIAIDSNDHDAQHDLADVLSRMERQKNAHLE